VSVAVDIDWAQLGKVAEVSAAFGVGIVAVFALGVLAATKVATARVAGRPLQRVGGLAIAAIAFALCAAAVLYGLYLIIPQFH
jgi:hypothetical protein